MPKKSDHQHARTRSEMRFSEVLTDRPSIYNRLSGETVENCPCDRDFTITNNGIKARGVDLSSTYNLMKNAGRSRGLLIYPLWFRRHIYTVGVV